MPRHMKNRYRFFPGEHVRFGGTVHYVHTGFYDESTARLVFATNCGLIEKAKGNRRTSHVVDCVLCIDGSVFSEPLLRFQHTFTRRISYRYSVAL